jgi:hypothetical protein
MMLTISTNNAHKEREERGNGREGTEWERSEISGSKSNLPSGSW